MTQRDYGSELYDKMKAEQDSYRDWLLQQEPSEILNHTYEYTMREDIMAEMGCINLTLKQEKALLKSPCPLADVYKKFRDMETEHMNVIRETIESRANEVIKREQARESR